MDYSSSEILRFVDENDVKFIRLAFCDIFGTQKNISIMPGELPRAFSEGISFDASAVKGFMNVDSSDLLLFPDPTTLSVLPWRPTQGRVVRLFCDIKYPNGDPFEGDGRTLLKNAVKHLGEMGLSCKIGTECEFYLFELDENGSPTKKPQDNAGYLDIAPLDKGENVRRQICLTLEEMGIQPESSHHEQGPGQNEIDFQYSDALTAADNLVTFKAVVKTAASANGLHASFLPKPFANKSGNGLHINLSLYQNGINIFENGDRHSKVCESFIAGIMSKTAEITAFLNPIVNSYSRFGHCEAPKYITWSHQNRSQLIRIPAASGEYRRMELRSPDPCLNPYLAFTLLIEAGIEGIEKNMQLSRPCNLNLFEAPLDAVKSYEMLPKNLHDAVLASKNSEFVERILPPKIITKFLDAKQNEWESFNTAEDKEALVDSLYFLNN